MEKKNWLYFAAQANEADNDGIDDSVCLPADSLISIAPSANNRVTLTFEPAKLNTEINLENITMDTVVLETIVGDAFEVANELVRFINKARANHDGFSIIADDMTTTHAVAAGEGTALNDLSVAGIYAHPSITGVSSINIGTAQYMRLPEMAWGGATTALSNSLALSVNTNYHSIAGACAVTIPSAAAGKAGDWITVRYDTVINDGVVHSYTTTTDATFTAGSVVTRIGGGVASGVDVSDGSAKNILTLDGDTNGDGGIGSYVRFVNTTGATDGWMVEAVLVNQGDGSAAMAGATAFS